MRKAILSKVLILMIISFGLSLKADEDPKSIKKNGLRTVFYEKFGNAGSIADVEANIIFNQFIESKVDSVVAIKYHSNFPFPDDPMYLSNPVQIDQRLAYYNVFFIPLVWVDGLIGFGSVQLLQNLQNAYNERIVIPSPVEISVIDTPIGQDSIMTTISLNILSVLPSGNYRLRVCAVEREINYPQPPGVNGETSFKNVFRKAYPDMNGTSLDTAAGFYQYEFTYEIETQWVDSSIYTIAFLQNDDNKEILNSAKAVYSPPTVIDNSKFHTPEKFHLFQNYPNPFNPSTTISYQLPERSEVILKVYNVLGEEIQTLVSQTQNAGEYSAIWDGANQFGKRVSSGIYVSRIKAGRYIKAIKMLYLK